MSQLEYQPSPEEEPLPLLQVVEGGVQESTENPEAWRSKAACKLMPIDFMFPISLPGVEDAIRVCSNCVVIEECLEYALENKEEHGVWGGTSERERRRIIARCRKQNQEKTN